MPNWLGSPLSIMADLLCDYSRWHDLSECLPPPPHGGSGESQVWASTDRDAAMPVSWAWEEVLTLLEPSHCHPQGNLWLAGSFAQA